MKKSGHVVDIIVDGRKIRTEGKDLILKVDGRSVYRSRDSGFKSKGDVKDLKISAMRSFLNAADSAFGHIDRFRIVKSLSESPKTFTEIKRLFDMTSPTANYHLKKLMDSLVIFKDENNKYSLTLLGELVFDYFSDFLNEAENLQKTLEQ